MTDIEDGDGRLTLCDLKLRVKAPSKRTVIDAANARGMHYTERGLLHCEGVAWLHGEPELVLPFEAGGEALARVRMLELLTEGYAITAKREGDD